MGDELPLIAIEDLSWIVSIDRELNSLKRLEPKFGLSFRNFSTTYL